MTRTYRIVSADTHTIEPPDMWQRYLPGEYASRAPRVVKDPEGGDAWELQRGAPPMPIGLVTVPGLRYEEFRWYGATYDSIKPGCFLGKPRLEEQDEDGIDAEVLFPSQRTMIYFMANEDDGFHEAGLDAYNTWILEEYAAADPERLVPMAQMPNLGVDASVAALRDAKRRGFRGVVISAWPSGGASLSRDDDPFWAAAEDEHMPVHVHGGISSFAQRRAGNASAAARFAGGLPDLHVMGGAVAQFSGTVAEIVYSGLFDRFPRLTIVGVEVGASWVPASLEHMDDHYWRNRVWTGTHLELMPSEYFKRNMKVTFIREPFAVRSRHVIGLGSMMWSTDYPHHRCDWPYSRRVIDEMFLGVPEDERHRIVCGNAVELYGLGA